ncbi:MAG: DUF2442 domain-containing protein [Ginsengibacter sp.]
MNTSHNKYDAIEHLIFKEGLKIKSVDFNKSLDKMHIHLTNDLIFIIPTASYPSLRNADKRKLNNLELIAGGTGIHWLDLDEDLSLKGFLKDYLKQRIRTEKELVLS